MANLFQLKFLNDRPHRAEHHDTASAQATLPVRIRSLARRASSGKFTSAPSRRGEDGADRRDICREKRFRRENCFDLSAELAQ
jgi:hypothetical protein